MKSKATVRVEDQVEVELEADVEEEVEGATHSKPRR